MPNEFLMSTTHEAPWLPLGSSAEVWVGHNCQIVEPVVVTRLLLVRRNLNGVSEFFCVPTPKGLNLPTRYLWTDPGSVTDLMRDVFGRADLATRCVGFIRNVVPSPDASYAYPTPWAHVPVNLITDTVEPLIAGEWISVVHGGSEFSEQHWWPIVEHYLSTQAG